MQYTSYSTTTREAAKKLWPTVGDPIPAYWLGNKNNGKIFFWQEFGTFKANKIFYKQQTLQSFFLHFKRFQIFFLSEQFEIGLIRNPIYGPSSFGRISPKLCVLCSVSFTNSIVYIGILPRWDFFSCSNLKALQLGNSDDLFICHAGRQEGWKTSKDTLWLPIKSIFSIESLSMIILFRRKSSWSQIVIIMIS